MAAAFLSRVTLLAEAWDDVQAQRLTPAGAQPFYDGMATLAAEAAALLGVHRPFHWELAFPEVFHAAAAAPATGQAEMPGFGTDLLPLFASPAAAAAPAPGFAAIIGNPPFMGGHRITGNLGTLYRDYLVQYVAGGKRGSADLSAYFFLRAGSMLQTGGGMGLLATNTIAQGDTREVGLDQLTQRGYTIVRAVPSRRWSGAAAVEVAHVWLRRGAWQGGSVLNDQPVAGITPYLTPPGKVVGNPYRLAANAGKSFKGSDVLGMGFVLEPDEAQALIAKDPRNKDVLFPFLNGQDLNSRPDQSPSRWVINFFDWTAEKAATYPDCWQIIEERVRPERQRTKEDGSYVLRKPLPQKYWIYNDKRPTLYATIAGLGRVLVLTIVSRTVAFTFVPAGQVYAHRLAVFATDTFAQFALLQSSCHYYWAWQYSSTMKSDLNYSPSDVFETFPFPAGVLGAGGGQVPPGAAATATTAALEQIGEQYHTHRQQVMLARQEGLTKTYNRMHDADDTSDDIAELRRLHAALDAAVAGAYGWHDLALDHGFHTTKQGVRYTISAAARQAVLDRLLALNHERHAAEVAAGLHAGGKGKGKGKGKRRR